VLRGSYDPLRGAREPKGGGEMKLTKNLLEWLEIKYLKPTIELAEEADDTNYQEKLGEIEEILKDALDYVQTLKK